MISRVARSPRSRSQRPGRAHALWHRLSLPRHTRTPEPLPIVLGRKRIYIVPTAFGVGFAVILVVMLLGALNYSNNAALLLTCLLGAATAGSMLTTFRNMDGLRLDAVRGGTARAGEPIRIVLDFAVAARPRTALRVDVQGQTLPFRIGDPHACSVELFVPTRRRGWMPVPSLRLHNTWPFGLFRAWSWLCPEQHVLVYPRPETDGPMPPGVATGQRERRQASSHQDDDLASLRAYRAGDPLKLVAWKASARHEDLLVREFEHPANPREWTLDWRSLTHLDPDRRIARLARWICEAQAARIHWTLRLPGQSLGPGGGDEHYHRCMRALALMPTHDPFP